MKIVNLKIDDIKPYENNPRINDAAVKEVSQSIKEFGFQQPIVIDKEKVIIVGHTRYKAAVMLRLDKVPCVIADNLTEEQCKAYRIIDNKTGELAKWDEKILIDELENIDLSEFGFDLDFDFDEEPIESIDLDDGCESVQKQTKESYCCPKCGFEFEV